MKNRKIIFVTSLSLLSILSTNVWAVSPDRYTDINEIVNNGVSLSLPQTLQVIYPITSQTTTGDTFYIAGTSDPSQPLYVGDREITDRSSNGMFEVNVSVPSDGQYACALKQGDTTKIVPIYKNVPVASPERIAPPEVAYTTSGFVDTSVYPSKENPIYNTKNITLSCQAPSGSNVTANFYGGSYKLNQLKSARKGVPAKFEITLDMNNVLEESKFYDLGKVIYTMEYDGVTSQAVSQGRIFYGVTLPPAVKISKPTGSLVDKSTDDAKTISELKMGSIDKVVDSTQDMYKLACGGWIHKNYAEPVTGVFDIYNHVGAIDYQIDQKSEQLILKGTANPIFTSSLLEDKLIVRLYNTDGISDIPSSIYQNSSLFSNISTQSGPNYVDITCSFKSKNTVWGYNVEFDGNNTVIYAKKKPILSQNAEKPLTGMTVVVDPGHGGSDSGAPGIIGSIGGSCEKDINLVNALAVRKRLEVLGATVILTRENDKYVSLYDRVAMMEKLKPDFIVSIHGNSIEKANIDVKGTEIYYSNPMSLNFAKVLSDTVSNYADRYNRGAKSKEFYVIRSTYCPSILAEIGFLTSPKDVASMMSANGIFSVANAFGDAIVNYIMNNSQQ